MRALFFVNDDAPKWISARKHHSSESDVKFVRDLRMLPGVTP